MIGPGAWQILRVPFLWEVRLRGSVCCSRFQPEVFREGKGCRFFDLIISNRNPKSVHSYLVQRCRIIVNYFNYYEIRVSFIYLLF